MIIRCNNDIIIVKLYKYYLNKVDLDIYNKDSIISFFENILYKIGKKYNNTGLFNVNIYENDDYGIIMEFININDYNNSIDFNISFHINCTFLYEYLNLDNGNNYLFNDCYYCDYINYECNVIYKDTENIINNGIFLK